MASTTLGAPCSTTSFGALVLLARREPDLASDDVAGLGAGL